LLYQVHLATGFDLSTLVMIGIDCTRSCKSSYLAITTTMPLPVNGIPNPLLILNGSSMWCRYKQYKNTTCTDSLPPRYPSCSSLCIIMLSCRSNFFSWFLFWKQRKFHRKFIHLYSWKKVTIFMKKNLFGVAKMVNKNKYREQ
jgi:hypothetical protein